jgi:hypothetical protein
MCRAETSLRFICGLGNRLNIQSHALNYYILNLDIDECTIGADNCNVKAYCNNTRDPYTCACKAWFTYVCDMPATSLFIAVDAYILL